MERLDDAEDKRLMAALATGDGTALDTLMARWQKPVRHFVLRYVSNEHDAEDLIQEAFVRVYRHRTRYRPSSRFSTWLFTIALNLCRNHAEKAGRRPTVSLDAPPAGAADSEDDARTALQRHATTEAGPSDQALASERAQAVRDAIKELPHDLRSAIVLFEYQHLSHAEIAEISGVTPKAVETRLYRARQRLRERLARWLVD